MVLYVLDVNPLALLQVREKEKTVEGRLYKGMITEIEPGDTIKFTNRRKQDSSVMSNVVDIRHYRTILEMLETEGLENVLPSRGMTCVHEGVEYYRSSPINYTVEKEKKYGVVAIKIEKIP